MNVDLTTLKPGDSVRLRNGEVIQWDGRWSRPSDFWLTHMWRIANVTFRRDGRFINAATQSDCDIVEILPREEGEKDVN